MKSRLPFIIGLTILLFMSTIALLAPVIAPDSPTHQDLKNDLRPPSQTFLLGTDKLGRDIASRIIYGSRISLLVGLSTVSISLLIGVLIGSLAGYLGGWIDQILMRIVDILLAFPGTLLVIAFTAVMGPSLPHVVLGLCLISWTGYARLVRGEILSLREKDFILAVKALGGAPPRVILFHLVPNLLPSLLIQSTFGVATAIVAEGALSFLGLGAQPPTPSWGSMLNEGRQFLLVAPHLTTFPGLAIMITVLSLNLVGDGLMRIIENRET